MNMKKYVVRYEVEGFVEKECFETLPQAQNYYAKICMLMGNYLTNIELYQI